MELEYTYTIVGRASGHREVVNRAEALKWIAEGWKNGKDVMHDLELGAKHLRRLGGQPSPDSTLRASFQELEVVAKEK